MRPMLFSLALAVLLIVPGRSAFAAMPFGDLVGDKLRAAIYAAAVPYSPIDRAIDQAAAVARQARACQWR